MMDTLKAAALVATFIGFLTIFAMWVSLWVVWRVSVDPVHNQVYSARMLSLSIGCQHKAYGYGIASVFSASLSTCGTIGHAKLHAPV